MVGSGLEGRIRRDWPSSEEERPQTRPTLPGSDSALEVCTPEISIRMSKPVTSVFNDIQAKVARCLCHTQATQFMFGDPPRG